MPIIAIGGFGGPTAEGRFAARDWLLTALKLGYRHVDTAANYYTEESVGAAIRNSGIARSELFVTTKLPMNGHGRVKYCFEHSLKELGLDYIDLYLMHYPVPVAFEEGNDFPINPDGTTRIDKNVTLNDIWADMEALLERGKVKALGVSNFSPKTLDQLLKTAKVIPAVNQVELHPYLVQENLRQYCKDKGIVVSAYTPSGRDIVRNDPKIVELAAKNKITPNQLILGWHLARDVAIIPGSKDAERQKENLKIPVIADEDVKQINALDRNDRIMNKYRVIKGTLWGWTYEQYGW
ncbi:reductase AKOR2 [Hymenopellis radicata]|nr:reductase AKOR2 [Hymenopellis radicata]